MCARMGESLVVVAGKNLFNNLPPWEYAEQFSRRTKKRDDFTVGVHLENLSCMPPCRSHIELHGQALVLNMG